MYVHRKSQFIYIYIPYSGKFLKGLIFENFESSQVFLKIFFRNQLRYHAHALPECFVAAHENDTS